MTAIHERPLTLLFQVAQDSDGLKAEMRRALAQDPETYNRI